MKKLFAVLGVASSLLGAGQSEAATWHAGNNAWADFDVGGGQFCGLRILPPEGLICSYDIPLALGPLYPYQPPVPPKRVALDQQNRIYIVGTDNKIYWQYGNRFTKYDWQPPLSCIDKLVVSQGSGTNARNQTMLVKGCDANKTTLVGYRGAWTLVGYNLRDISKSSSATLDSLSILGATGSLSTALLQTPGVVNWSTLGGQDFSWTYNGFQGGPVEASRIGGITFFLNAFSTCHNDNPNLPPGQFGQVYVPGKLFAGATGTGCDYLVLPPGSFDPSGDLIEKVVSAYQGPGGASLWVLTNISQVYAYGN